jgi:hypothetical protein
VVVWYWLTWAIMGTFRIAAYWVVLFYLGCDLFGTVLSRNSGIAYIAHLAGALGGIAVSLTLLKMKWIESDRGEENLLQLLGGPKQKRRRRKDPRWDRMDEDDEFLPRRPKREVEDT